MTTITDVIRTIVVQTMRAEKPTERVFGVVTSLEPFKVQVNEKLVLSDRFLAITQTVKGYIESEFLQVGDKVIMTRQVGGQLYVVDDMLPSDKSYKELVLWNHKHEYEDDDGQSTTTKTTEKGEKV